MRDLVVLNLKQARAALAGIRDKLGDLGYAVAKANEAEPAWLVRAREHELALLERMQGKREGDVGFADMQAALDRVQAKINHHNRVVAKLGKSSPAGEMSTEIKRLLAEESRARRTVSELAAQLSLIDQADDERINSEAVRDFEQAEREEWGRHKKARDDVEFAAWRAQRAKRVQGLR